MRVLQPLARATLLAGTVALTLSSCSSCEAPEEPVLPADLSGHWTGAYTLFDGTGRALTDSLLVDIKSNRGQLSGAGSRTRYLPEQEPMEGQIRVEGSVVINTFRIEFVDPATGNRALYSGKVDGDTLSGRLSVDGNPVGDLRMTGYR